MTLKTITELPAGEYILACHKTPDLSHAFIVFGEAGIVALAKQSGFQYRADVDFIVALETGVFVGAPSEVKRALENGKTFTYVLYPDDTAWYESGLVSEQSIADFAMEFIYQEYDEVLVIPVTEAQIGDWHRVPEDSLSWVVPAVERALGRALEAEMRYQSPVIH